ncbi:MAG TPA: mechanosensitive ion channel protein, partial [Telluria sp.]|nr:mechanosensitive ion channel protein [Telluria sp.]
MPLTNLLEDLIADLSEPDILWQAVAIAASIVLGWLLALTIRRLWLHGRTPEGGMLRTGVESFARVLSPLLVVALLYGSRLVLKAAHIHVNVVRVAIPLFTSLAVIRLAFYLLRRVFARRGELGAAFVTFEKIFALLVWLGVALYITGLWPDVHHYLNSIELPIGKHHPTVFAILQGGISVVILILLALWAGAALEEKLM